MVRKDSDLKLKYNVMGGVAVKISISPKAKELVEKKTNEISLRKEVMRN